MGGTLPSCSVSEMSGETNPMSEPDPTFARVSETSLRMMAGTVSGTCQRQLREMLQEDPDVYPWDEACEAVLIERVDPTELVNKGIVSQRNWILRGVRERDLGAGRRRAKVERAFKALVAFAIVRGLFYGFFALAFLFFLLVLKHKWPGADIYRILDWLREVLPGLFGGG